MPPVSNAAVARMALGHLSYWEKQGLVGRAGAATVRLALQRLEKLSGEGETG